MDDHNMKIDVRERLDNELESINFSEDMKQAVLCGVKKTSFWNREMTLSLPSAIILLLLVIGGTAGGWLYMNKEAEKISIHIEDTQEQRVQEREERIVVTTSGVFFASQLEEGW